MTDQGQRLPADFRFGTFKDIAVRSRRENGRTVYVVSDYLEDAPQELLDDLVAAVRSKKGFEWPKSLMDHVWSDAFIVEKRPIFIKRSKNLKRTTVGDAYDLIDSVQRLLDSGLVSPEDISNSYISWSRQESVRKVGLCMPLFRVIWVSSILDDPSVPEFVIDFIVYHEILHLRLEGKGRRHRHDSTFRRMESAFPKKDEAMAFINSLNR